MSWSVAAIGKASAVRASIADQFAKQSKCMEPEESVRQAAATLIDASLAAQDPATAVRVSASGSQGFKDWDKKTGVFNSASIVVEPQHGFVE
jgi:hypothetical protein